MKKEFRIGNYVDLGNRIAYISEILHDGYTCIDLEETQDTFESTERVKPVQLTNEFLIQIGCTQSQEDSMFFLEGFGLIDFDGRGNFEWIYNDGLYVKLNYIHQLQNLYFALKGEEIIK